MKHHYNTDHLGYKLLSGKLKENRVHSEQLNKYLAGFIDSDGCISYRIDKGRFSLQFQLSQAAVNDPDFSILRSLRDFYNLGSCYYEITEKWSSCCKWKMYGKDIDKLANLVMKHMYTKGRQMDNMIWLASELQGVILTKAQEDDLRIQIACLKAEYGPLKEKKHPSWAWLAGLIHGDGNLLCRTDRVNKKRHGDTFSTYVSTELRVHIYSHRSERCVLEFIKKSLGGTLRDDLKTNTSIYQHGLGKQNIKFANKFIPKILPYMLHPKKYEVLNRMQTFHRELAETKQCVTDKVK